MTSTVFLIADTLLAYHSVESLPDYIYFYEIMVYNL